MADQSGRIYDPAGMAWFDGANQCWTGTQPWTFKSGSWYYGGARWYRSGDGWRSDISDPPAPVACHTVPAFATVQPAHAAAPGVSQAGSLAGPVAQNADRGPERVEPTARVTRPPASPGRPAALCKKYFPSIGEVAPVPCER